MQTMITAYFERLGVLAETNQLQDPLSMQYYSVLDLLPLVQIMLLSLVQIMLGLQLVFWDSVMILSNKKMAGFCLSLVVNRKRGLKMVPTLKVGKESSLQM